MCPPHSCAHQGPGGVQVLKSLKTVSHVVSRLEESLQSALVLGSVSSAPNGGGGEDGLIDQLPVEVLGARLFLKSTTIVTVFKMLSSKLF